VVGDRLLVITGNRNWKKGENGTLVYQLPFLEYEGSFFIPFSNGQNTKWYDHFLSTSIGSRRMKTIPGAMKYIDWWNVLHRNTLNLRIVGSSPTRVILKSPLISLINRAFTRILPGISFPPLSVHFRPIPPQTRHKSRQSIQRLPNFADVKHRATKTLQVCPRRE
jgi:hypothetical protein